MTETEDGKFVPNFKFRYLWEDIPFGMAVIKGIATIAGVQTPNIDKVSSIYMFLHGIKVSCILII